MSDTLRSHAATTSAMSATRAARPSAMPAPHAATTSAMPGPHDAASARFMPARVELEARAMGTRLLLAAYTTEQLERPAVEGALQLALAEFARIEALMTPWRASSELSAVNAAAGKSAVTVGEDTLAVIAKSLWIARESGGVFDITFASMGKLWRFDRELVPEVPDARVVAKARRRIDFRGVFLDESARTVKLARKDQLIDLGGIAKGYAVDRASLVLRHAGLSSFYVQAGGDLFIAGTKPEGEAYKVGIRDPRGADGSFFARLPVTDHAFSTAGDYERAFLKDGRRYHHIIDPRTGFPATASRSVTIWAKDAFTADAIDDAVFILGPEQGLRLVESIEDCGAVIVGADNRVWISSRLKPLVEVLRAPTDGT
ncbi:MAG: FAD:protein FMN transferase [Myxococcales bacterium]|nr:FAD:protein FMN transferase [Myxococcales bacterium]